MTKAFNPGDTVRLKSGSPAMTVSSYNSNGSINCTWYAPAIQDFKTQSFWQEMLIAAKPNSEFDILVS